MHNLAGLREREERETHCKYQIAHQSEAHKMLFSLLLLQRRKWRKQREIMGGEKGERGGPCMKTFAPSLILFSLKCVCAAKSRCAVSLSVFYCHPASHICWKKCSCEKCLVPKLVLFLLPFFLNREHRLPSRTCNVLIPRSFCAVNNPPRERERKRKEKKGPFPASESRIYEDGGTEFISYLHPFFLL